MFAITRAAEGHASGSATIKTARTRAQRSAPRGDFARYEALKASFTATATTSSEYEAACRLAARIAGV